VSVQQEGATMSQVDCTHSIRSEPRSSILELWAQWFGYGIVQAVAVGSVWLDRSRQRRQLAQLSDHMLRDIGLTRVDAWAEAEKPFWRP
jgi:uncharacterized protein YjiS (DUF1127 family)